MIPSFLLLGALSFHFKGLLCCCCCCFLFGRCCCLFFFLFSLFCFLFFQSLHHKEKRLLPAHVFCARLTAIERVAFTSYLIYFLVILLFITAILKMLVLSRILPLKLERPYLRPRHLKCHSWAGVVCLLNSFSDYI